jgi:hypothetical protein
MQLTWDPHLHISQLEQQFPIKSRSPEPQRTSTSRMSWRTRAVWGTENSLCQACGARQLQAPRQPPSPWDTDARYVLTLRQIYAAMSAAWSNGLSRRGAGGSVTADGEWEWRRGRSPARPRPRQCPCGPRQSVAHG